MRCIVCWCKIPFSLFQNKLVSAVNKPSFTCKTHLFLCRNECFWLPNKPSFAWKTCLNDKFPPFRCRKTMLVRSRMQVAHVKYFY